MVVQWLRQKWRTHVSAQSRLLNISALSINHLAFSASLALAYYRKKHSKRSALPLPGVWFIYRALARSRTYRTKLTRSLSLLLVQHARCGLVVAGYRGVEPPASMASNWPFPRLFCVHLNFSIGDRGSTYRGRTPSQRACRNCPQLIHLPPHQANPSLTRARALAAISLSSRIFANETVTLR